MKVVVVGTGYVGLVTGVCFADVGIEVFCVDKDKAKIDNLKKGISPIYEQGLDELLKNNIEKERIRFTTSIAEVLDGADVVFCAVGTPPDEDGSADLKYVLEVATEVGQNMSDYLLFVTKSTVPVGTAEKVKRVLAEQLEKRKLDCGFDVASNPEFLKEGSAIKDFMFPERIVVGVETERAKEVMASLYRPFTLNGHPVYFMNIPSAEMTKYAANSMLATRISFMNDIANLCELVGADVNSVRQGIGSDTRIGSKFLYPGIGYGGSCFPKDVKALIKIGQAYGYDLEVLRSVENINERQKSLMFRKFLKYYDGKVAGRKVALWGTAFKPGTDDMREAPSLVMMDALVEAGCKVAVYDPIAMKECERRVGDKVEYARDMYSMLEGADALFLVTEWTEFRFPDWGKIGEKMANKVIFDGRNLYRKDDVLKFGFDYLAVGIN